MAPNSLNCVYINCSSNLRRNRYLSFFTFPIKDSDRLEEWKNNCGNKNIANMDINQLGAKLVCELHFPSKYIMKYNYRDRKLLTRTAVPYKYDAEPQVPIEEGCLAVGQHSKIYDKKHLLTSDSDTSTYNCAYINCSSNIKE